MPYKNLKHKARHQRQQRRAGEVKRIEIVLSADNSRDHGLHDFLASLPRGAVSEFIKAAIQEKIQREGEQHTPEVSSASEQFNTILAELAALRKAVTQPVYAQVERSAPHTPGEAPSRNGPTVSSGLDMSAPRRKRDSASPGAPIPKAPPPVPEELTEAQRADLARQLVNSINAFGQNRSERR
jgi:hypothetical protein